MLQLQIPQQDTHIPADVFPHHILLQLSLCCLHPMNDTQDLSHVQASGPGCGLGLKAFHVLLSPFEPNSLESIHVHMRMRVWEEGARASTHTHTYLSFHFYFFTTTVHCRPKMPFTTAHMAAHHCTSTSTESLNLGCSPYYI